MPDADPAHYVLGQYEGYLDIDGVADGSTTETYTALRLEIENWRWSGVPFFIRAGKRLPATQTELRLVFKHPPKLGFGALRSRAPEPNQIAVRLVYRGKGFGVFSYLEGYKFTVSSSYTFSAEPGKVTTVKVVGYEKGGLTTDLKDRPAVRYDVEVNRDAAPKPQAQAEQKEKK